MTPFYFTRRFVATVGITGCVVVGAYGSSALAGDTDSATADVSLTVLQAISITRDTDMDFGTVFTGHAGSVAADTPAAFSVTGEAEENYTIDVPSDTTITNGTDTATVTLTPSAAGGTLVGGNDAFTVSGEIASVPASSGVYTGSFTATVSYDL